jgi:homoserine O-succinyltransferase/O-acetyltransferase
MPVRIPNDLPARRTLEDENIFVMTAERAIHQDIRPLRIAVLNLMPAKIVTETQLLRLLGNTSLQVDITFIHMESHESRTTSEAHLEAFYEPSRQVLGEKFDGLVITGAPVETLPFEEVDYWSELSRIMEWSKASVWSTMHICWGAQAGLFYHHGVPKYPLAEKMFGLFHHRVLMPAEPLMRGFDEVFLAPQSRHTEVRAADIRAVPGLKLLSTSEEAGVYIVATSDGRQVFVTGHPEYDRMTLKAEYDRDVAKGMAMKVPANYYPGNNPSLPPVMTWRSHAHLLYANWLNYHVYQGTPYDLERLPSLRFR